MKELLRLEHIHFQYEEKSTALNDVSVTICKGERIAVLGNNGAGKSTFFLCCNGVLHPQKGKIFLKGKEVGKSKKAVFEQRRTVGLVFQDPDSQIIAGTVESEVSFGPMNLRLVREEVENRVTQSLDWMNLEKYRYHAPQYLSGGEKKRVSIADILAMQPDMIMLDEPTASLDPENVTALENTLEQLSLGGIALVVSTHDVDFAYRFAERAIVFSCGEVIADSPVDSIFESEETLIRARLKKPAFYAAAQLLELRFPGNSSLRKTRHIDEFQSFINHINIQN